MKRTQPLQPMIGHGRPKDCVSREYGLDGSCEIAERNVLTKIAASTGAHSTDQRLVIVEGRNQYDGNVNSLRLMPSTTSGPERPGNLISIKTRSGLISEITRSASSPLAACAITLKRGSRLSNSTSPWRTRVSSSTMTMLVMICLLRQRTRRC